MSKFFLSVYFVTFFQISICYGAIKAAEIAPFIQSRGGISGCIIGISGTGSIAALINKNSSSFVTLLKPNDSHGACNFGSERFDCMDVSLTNKALNRLKIRCAAHDCKTDGTNKYCNSWGSSVVEKNLSTIYNAAKHVSGRIDEFSGLLVSKADPKDKVASVILSDNTGKTVTIASTSLRVRQQREPDEYLETSTKLGIQLTDLRWIGYGDKAIKQNSGFGLTMVAKVGSSIKTASVLSINEFKQRLITFKSAVEIEKVPVVPQQLWRDLILKLLDKEFSSETLTNNKASFSPEIYLYR